MTNYIYITGDSEIRVWGLSGRERLQRMLAGYKQSNIISALSDLPAGTTVLLLRGDYIYDPRVLAALINSTDLFYLGKDDHDHALIALRTVAEDAAALETSLISATGRAPALTLPVLRLEDLSLEFQEKLKKNDPPYALAIERENQRHLESALFAGSYKGVTDLVTKWLWPLPAFQATRFCVRYGLKPNHVTLSSLVLTILTGAAFYLGYYSLGLLMGWIMTFLDTVDGKLARVTVTASRFGDILDHGIDLVHPPFWYLCWGVGLAQTSVQAPSLTLLMWLMFLGYIGGRLCEGAFQLWAARFSIFLWKPFDSFNRLITARRNPNLILLTVSLLISRPDLGLLWVVFWHLISTLILCVRLTSGIIYRRRYGPLSSWLMDTDSYSNTLAVKIFTRLQDRNHS